MPLDAAAKRHAETKKNRASSAKAHASSGLRFPFTAIRYRAIAAGHAGLGQTRKVGSSEANQRVPLLSFALMPESGSRLESSLLVAMPQLQDPNFRRAVVLLVQHDGEGTFGLVLNRPAELSTSDLCGSLDVRWRGDPNASIHWGGPVQPNTGWVLFDREDALPPHLEEIKTIASGVCFAGSLDVFRAVAESPPSAVQLYLGYAGWGAGQLEAELAAGAWLVAPGSADVIFDVAPGGMWTHVVRSLGVDPTTLVSTHGVH